MIDIYDGNNVMRRAMEKKSLLPGERPMSLRMRYEHCMFKAPGTQIWVWDGKNHNARRRDIYPPYKMNRTPTPEDIFAQIRLWRDILKHSHAVQVEVEGWEADDVIAYLVRRMPGRCIVHTNDMDYGQIAHLCTLNGVNMKGVPANRVALYKAMNGDSSDNIAGIPNFGGKRWLDMEPYWAQIERAIAAGDPVRFVDLPFKPGVKAWLTSQDNIDLLQRMLLVTHFQQVPTDELEGGIRQGVPNRPAALELMEKFFL